ncbi:MAG: ribbon-helix-helix domain-containing protein [Nocardioidaceae bacterium]|nr:ribbon-helix-helix domain-containing protein [Nocardioidaceae bacterium]MCL2615053.1 ribbon-helix-helix domain-containing protein [Nocardioidaceae bacterium]
MQRTNIYLEDRQTAALDRMAADEGVSRAELIRRIIDDRLAGTSEDVEVDLFWIDASFGIDAGLGLPDRGPDERAAHLDRVRRATP